MPIAPKVFRAGGVQPTAGDRDRWRGSTTERGYDRQWRNLRNWWIKRNPLCVECLKAGRVNAGEPNKPNQVDHIRSFRGRQDPLRLSVTNLQVLCTQHHSAKTRRDHSR